jgi:hypothetical protein
MTWFIESAIFVDAPQQEFAGSDRHPQGPPAVAWAYRSLTILRILSDSFSFMLDLLQSSFVTSK